MSLQSCEAPAQLPSDLVAGSFARFSMPRPHGNNPVRPELPEKRHCQVKGSLKYFLLFFQLLGSSPFLGKRQGIRACVGSRSFVKYKLGSASITRFAKSSGKTRPHCRCNVGLLLPLAKRHSSRCCCNVGLPLPLLHRFAAAAGCLGRVNVSLRRSVARYLHEVSLTWSHWRARTRGCF